MRQSLGTRNFEAAHRMVREWEEQGKAVEGITVAEAFKRFIADCKARGLGSAQLGKYELLETELKDEFGQRPVVIITADDLRAFREKWSVASVTAYKKLERLRTFFRFCHDSGWISKNPARVLKPPKVKMKPTLPLSKEQLEKITWAFEVYPDRPKGRREQVRAFILLLRYSGLRIGDAVSLTADKIHDGKLMLYTGKTGTPVYLPLPEEVESCLKHVADIDGRFFWSGNGILKSAVADWQRSLSKLFKLAGVKAHAHQFRHTFAVNLLQSGVSLETVSILLGHSSLKITEKHYAPWVKSRQIALEAEIQKAWNTT
ncbi:MAG TPA: tyrosine-type recombinase/integrase [Patescibacteria group bacterium]|nr:tyrosine-type recombinase/integrase [Patescibacteria group bacterium]